MSESEDTLAMIWGQGPAIVPMPSKEQGGVDYLGLRQVNLDLMAKCLPSVTNTTRHIRPFALLCWIHWKFHSELAAAGKIKVPSREQRIFQDKVETLFTWGHQLSGMRGVPGLNAVCPASEPGGWVDLNFKAWGRKATNTSLQAAVQYGPAMKSSYGYGFIEPTDERQFRVTPLGRAMAEHLDAELRGSSAYRLISSLERDRGRAADAESLWGQWRVDAPSAKERKEFRAVFYDAAKINDKDSLGLRSATVSAVITILNGARKGLSEDEIRRALSWKRIPKGKAIVLSGGPEWSANHWIVLQVRQAQRASLEWLLTWLERKLLAGMNGVESLRAEIFKELDGEKISEGGRSTGRDTLKRFCRGVGSLEAYFTESAAGSERCLFNLTDGLMDSAESTTSDILKKIVLVHLATLAVSKWLAGDSFYSADLAMGGADRISLGHQLARWEKFHDREFRIWIADILEHWVLSQHMSVATFRYTGRSQRLRFSFDENGLEFYPEKVFRPGISADHLSAALSLMAESGLINWDESTGLFRMGQQKA